MGKTTLALAVADTRPSVYLDLESEADRAKLVVPELYLAAAERCCRKVPGTFQGNRFSGLLLGYLSLGERAPGP